jgi:hypothetical protein
MSWRYRWARVVCTLVASTCAAALATPSGAQSAEATPRELRIEVRDREGHAIPEARINLTVRGDSAITDSLGLATLEITTDTLLVISIRKIGYQPRAARLRIGTAPGFIVRVVLGSLGDQLPAMTVRADYREEPWREGFDTRRRNSSGSFRDRSYFNGRQIQMIDDWFGGMPGIQISSRSVRINRCARVGVWIDGMHLTGGGLSALLAFNQVSGNDIAAVEVYRIAQQQAQFSDPNREDCSVLIWTRSR